MASEAEIAAAKKAVEQIEVHAGDRANLVGNRQIYELLTGWVVDEIVRTALDAAARIRADAAPKVQLMPDGHYR